MTEPRIERISKKLLVGKRLKMSYSNNKTGELWRSFMVIRKEIKNNLSTDLISMQNYDCSIDFMKMSKETEFEKWAVAEVSDFNSVPDSMEKYTLEGGLYAVFIHKGIAGDFEKTFHNIFHEWLPGSGFELDKREHFEILGEKYKNNDPDSEEEIWVPIKKR